ncbi:hypothetical protein ACKLNQ_14250 [Myroides odoratimimus]|uniref:hypothetical protein n=1 Tax=Myroides odoratimimus TaxID=76832 RepID=UPI0038D40070
MKKIYFMMGLITLSATVVSCSNDDNLQQDIQAVQKEKQAQEVLTTLEVKSFSDDNMSDRGDFDLDKDKTKREGKGK